MRNSAYGAYICNISKVIGVTDLGLLQLEHTTVHQNHKPSSFKCPLINKLI
jgi:hypothetical protein